MSRPSDKPEWVTVQEAHARLNGAVSLTTVYAISHSGEVRSTRLRGRIVLDWKQLQQRMTEEGFALITPRQARRETRPSRVRRAGPTLKESA